MFSKLFNVGLALAAVLATEGAVLPRQNPPQYITSSLTPTQNITSTITPTQNVTSSITPTQNITSTIPPNTTFASTTPTPNVTTSTTAVINATSTAPTTTPSITNRTTSTVRARAVSCDGLQNWQSNLAYSAGDKVIFNGHLFTANQWSYNSSPGSSTAWTDGGDCTQPISNKANCAGVSAWQMSQAYPTGSRVTFNGHLWSAVQWTSSNTPGDTSGTWKDLGVCA